MYRKYNFSFLEARKLNFSFLIDNRVKQNINGPPKRVMGSGGDSHVGAGEIRNISDFECGAGTYFLVLTSKPVASPSQRLSDFVLLRHYTWSKRNGYWAQGTANRVCSCPFAVTRRWRNMQLPQLALIVFQKGTEPRSQTDNRRVTRSKYHTKDQTNYTPEGKI